MGRGARVCSCRVKKGKEMFSLATTRGKNDQRAKVLATKMSQRTKIGKKSYTKK